MKIHVQGSTSLNTKLFVDNGVDLVSTPDAADYILVKSAVNFPEHIARTIYVSREPPKERHVVWCYERLDDFKLVVAYEPDPKKHNQIPFNEPSYPNWVSVPPRKSQPETRNDITIRTRGVFFAGNNRQRPDQKSLSGATNINHIRKIIGEYAIKELRGSVVIGVGWPTNSRSEVAWADDKMKQIKESSTDFVLALENTIFPNYLSEKIWHGLYSDRVTLYLGDPNIDNYMPPDCFVDLRPYYDISSKTFDIERLGDRLKNMTQDEYSSIIMNARKVRTSYSDARPQYRDDLTMRILNRLKQ